MPAPIITCIYCGKTAPSSREHIVQDGLGGVERLPDVCEPCNKRMSEIDEALCAKSPLSIYCRRVLNRYGPSTVWDVDENNRNLLLEARQTPGTDSMTLLPQLIFDGRKKLFYDDIDEMTNIGVVGVQRAFFPRLKKAFKLFQKYGKDARKKDHKGKDMLKIQRIKTVRDQYRLPPRVCSYHNVAEYKGAVMFVLRYHDDADLETAIKKLKKLKWQSRIQKVKTQLGTKNPEVHISFSPEVIIRAVSKIGFNILARFCITTQPCIANYQPTIDWIFRNRWRSLFGCEKMFGFVKPDGVTPLGCPPAAHKFRLTYNADIGRWFMYASFFGGKAATFVSIYGPNDEPWKTIEVVAPYGKYLDPPSYFPDFMPLDVNVAMDMREILPFEPWDNGECRLRREIAPSWRSVS